MASRLIDKDPPETYPVLFVDLDHLDGSLITALNKEAVFAFLPSGKTTLSRLIFLGQTWQKRFRHASGTFKGREAAMPWNRRTLAFTTS